MLPFERVMERMTGEEQKIKNLLDEKAVLYNREWFIKTDPIKIPKKFTQKEDIEIAGFLTATLSWGQRITIITKALDLLNRMGNQPFNFIVQTSEKEMGIFNDFKHRTFNGEDSKFFILSLRNIYREHGGLQAVFEKGYQKDGTVKTALSYFHSVFFEIEGLRRTHKHVSDVSAGSSAKRLNMYLRWMVRQDESGVDFGLWKGIPRSQLMLPLDIHTGNTARKLGLLHRKVNDWKAVEEVTGELRKFDPVDPVKYDFALFGLSVFEKF